MSKRIVLFLALTVWIPPSASADDDWTASLFLGHAVLMEDWSPSGSIGARVGGYDFIHRVFAIGAEIGFYRLGTLEFESTDPSGRPLPAADMNFSTWQVTGQVMARGTVGRTHPYLTLGAGAYQFQISEVANSERVLFEGSSLLDMGLNFGWGISLLPTSGPISIGFDVRLHVILDDGQDLNWGSVMFGVGYD